MTTQSLSVLIDLNVCGHCGGCVPVCPTDAIYLSPLALEIDDGLCTACGNCVSVCPVGALELADNG